MSRNRVDDDLLDSGFALHDAPGELLDLGNRSLKTGSGVIEESEGKPIHLSDFVTVQ